MAYLGNGNTITVAGMVLPLTNLIRLVGYSADNTNRYATLREFGGSAGYTVPAGYRLRIYALIVEHLGSSGGSSVRCCRMAQTDNDNGMSGTTALTNPVWVGGSNLIALGTMSGSTSESRAKIEIPLNFTVAESKYVTCDHYTASTYNMTFYAFGYLEAV